LFNVGCLLFVGIRAVATNTFTTGGSSHIDSSDKKCDSDWQCLKHNKDVHIELFGANWATLAGILTLSFFIHNVICVIMRNNEKQDKNVRDLSLGYIAVGTCYVLIGILGYLGFRGNGFP
jgi:hypothetical protein